LNIANNTYQEYYKNFSYYITSLNNFLNREIKTESGWRNIKLYNDKILLLMNSFITVGANFMEKTNNHSNTIISYFEYYSNISIVMFVVSFLLVLTGIYFSRLSFERK